MDDESKVPFSTFLVERRIAAAEGKRLDREKALRKSGTAKPASAATRTRRIPVPPAPATTSAAPAERYVPKGTHWHVSRDPGTAVWVKTPHGEKVGKVAYESDAGAWVTVDTHKGRVRARPEDLRPLSQSEIDEHYEREDADQEQRGRVSVKYAHDDLLAGMRITVVEGEHDGSGEEITGRIASIEPRDGGHVVVKSFRDGKRRLTVHELHKIVQVHEEP